MRRPLAGVTLGIAVLVAGCGASTHDGAAASGSAAAYSPTTSPSPSGSPTAPLSLPESSSCPGLRRARWPSTKLGPADPVDLAQNNQLAALPVPGLAGRTVTEVAPYATARAFVDTNAVSDPEARLAAMARDGFRGGVNVGYASGADEYGVIILRFASPAAALDYFSVHLRSICSISTQVSSLSPLAGVAYLRSDDLAKASFVVGDTEVQLDVCTCVQVNDRVDLAGRWATNVARQLAGP